MNSGVNRLVISRLLKNFSAHAAGQVINILIQVVSVPLFLHCWETDVYSEWIILTSLTSLLGLSDLGFAGTAGNEMAIQAARNDRDSVLTTFQSMFVLLVFLSSVATATLICVLYFVDLESMLNLSEGTSKIASIVIMFLAAGVLVGMFHSLLNAAFRCNGYYSLSVWLGNGCRILTWALQMVVLIMFESMILLAAIGFFIPLLMLLVNYYVLKARNTFIELGSRFARLSTVARLILPSLGSMAFPLGTAMNNHVLLQIIAFNASPSFVVIYATHRTLSNMTSQFLYLVNNSILPELSKSHGEGNFSLMRAIHRRSCGIALLLALLSGFLTVLFAQLVLSLWTNDRIQCDPALTMVLVLAVIFRSLWLTSSAVLYASNSHLRISLIFLVFSILSCCTALVLIRSYGFVGLGIVIILLEILMIPIVLRSSLRLTSDNLVNFVLFSFPRNWNLRTSGASD